MITAWNIANSFGAGMGNMEGTCGGLVGAEAYEALAADGQRVGGAIIVIKADLKK